MMQYSSSRIKVSELELKTRSDRASRGSILKKISHKAPTNNLSNCQCSKI